MRDGPKFPPTPVFQGFLSSSVFFQIATSSIPKGMKESTDVGYGRRKRGRPDNKFFRIWYSSRDQSKIIRSPSLRLPLVEALLILPFSGTTKIP